jgi:hypothetical protein
MNARATCYYAIPHLRGIEIIKSRQHSLTLSLCNSQTTNEALYIHLFLDIIKSNRRGIVISYTEGSHAINVQGTDALRDDIR